MALRFSITESTASITPRRTSTGLAPLVIFSNPSLAIDLAKTVAAVVPSPADSFVLLATSCTSLAPMFWNLSFSSIPLATVTPSLVILGEPHDCSRITFRPCQQNLNIRTATNRILFIMEKTLGPIVTATASARTSTPCNINARTSAPNRTSLA